MQSKKVNSRSQQVVYGKPSLVGWVFGAFLLLMGCKNEASKGGLPKEEVQGLSEDFLTFYKKFHADSAYQMAHIEFPLAGYPMGNSASDSSFDAKTFRWTPETWTMHRMNTLNDTAFTRQFEQPMPMVVSEVIVQKQTHFGTVRRFLKRGDEWFLIFYADMNRIER